MKAYDTKKLSAQIDNVLEANVQNCLSEALSLLLPSRNVLTRADITQNSKSRVIDIETEMSLIGEFRIGKF
ncbi:MAG: hypothetical protein HON76_00160 [Candidatus Scalindua sp.]|jgi:hypothetical protein|nr:hypothetical protein [Candidatus Scalindua sp.]MBT5303873.1 hypothetical protein [Candidatus Scalindua sp.]MBT6045753.1 hypothetical protein [Candidatus Scalindua sp.]MBT6228180.1 hypothetical protein [Candidatus Scalindua sp.]MBT6560924.1 hypothetical protein [Candidatus Scalindua sp.]